MTEWDKFVEKFLEEYEKVCRKFGIVIDSEGGWTSLTLKHWNSDDLDIYFEEAGFKY